MTRRRGWRPAGGWEAIVGGHGADRHVVYWRRRLPDGAWLTAKGRRWAYHARPGPDGVIASGIAPNLAAAKRAAETASTKEGPTQ